MAISLKAKLTVNQRIRTIAVLKQHRFHAGSVATTDFYCDHIAEAQGIGHRKLDYEKHRATPTRPDPVDGVPFKMAFTPEIERGLVTCCKWDVRRARFGSNDS